MYMYVLKIELQRFRGKTTFGKKGMDNIDEALLKRGKKNENQLY